MPMVVFGALRMLSTQPGKAFFWWLPIKAESVNLAFTAS